MLKSNSIMRAATAAVVAVEILVVPAAAVPVAADYLVAGDGLLTYDADTNLEWLDLSQTVGQSYNTVLAGSLVGGGGGFTIATTGQLSSLVSNAGILLTVGNWPAYVAEATTLTNLLSITGTSVSAQFTETQAWGWADSGSLLEASLSKVSYATSGTQWTQPSGSTGLKTTALSNVGVFLVREAQISAVPLPAALPLLLSALGFFGFIGWRRKKFATA